MEKSLCSTFQDLVKHSFYSNYGNGRTGQNSEFKNWLLSIHKLESELELAKLYSKINWNLNWNDGKWNLLKCSLTGILGNV